MRKQKAAATTFNVGDRVKLKSGVQRIEVNDFENYRTPYYFEVSDVATVFEVNDLTLVRFEKAGFKKVLAQLAARVETSDLELVS